MLLSTFKAKIPDNCEINSCITDLYCFAGVLQDLSQWIFNCKQLKGAE